MRLIGQSKQAASTHQKAIEFRPPFASAHSNLGLALIEPGEIEQAIAAYQQAAILRPDRPRPGQQVIFRLLISILPAIAGHRVGHKMMALPPSFGRCRA